MAAQQTYTHKPPASLLSCHMRQGTKDRARLVLHAGGGVQQQRAPLSRHWSTFKQCVCPSVGTDCARPAYQVGCKCLSRYWWILLGSRQGLGVLLVQGATHLVRPAQLPSPKS